MTEYVIEKITAKNGEMSLKINEYSIHSRYNPIREAESIVKKYYQPHHTHIFFGYGAGHLHEAFKKMRKHDELFLTIDPLFDNNQLPIRSEHQQDKLFNTNSIDKLEFLLDYLSDEARTKYVVVCLSNYDKIFPETYKALLQKIKDIQEFNRVNDYTVIRFAEEWQKNIKLNLVNLYKDTSLEKLYQKYNIPIVIAASGPSLLKQIPTLKKHRRKFLLISAGSTTKVLLDQGLTPDFIISMDGGIANYKHFKNITIEDARLIYPFQNYPKVRDSFAKQAFICNLEGSIGVGEYVNNVSEINIPTIIGGATVANLAFSVAQYISSGPIAFIGQDMAFTGNKTHVNGHQFSKEIDLTEQKEKQYLYTDGYNGEKVLTSPVMYSMKLNFEKMILVQPPKNEFFNCTEGGVTIKGYEQISFNDFCEKYALSEFDLDIAQYTPCMKKEDLIARFEKEKNLLLKAIKLYDKASKEIHNNKMIDGFTVKTLKLLDKTDVKVREIVNEVAVSTILTPILFKLSTSFLEMENETKHQMYKRIKAQNVALYEESTEAFKKALTFIDEAIEKLKETSE